MTINCNGRVNVTTPGTPVRLSTNPSLAVSKLLFQAVPGLTGKTYVGNTSMTKATFAGCARVLAPNPAGAVPDTFWIQSQDGTNSIRLMDYAIDADNAGEGLLVSYWTE